MRTMRMMTKRKHHQSKCRREPQRDRSHQAAKKRTKRPTRNPAKNLRPARTRTRRNPRDSSPAKKGPNPARRVLSPAKRPPSQETRTSRAVISARDNCEQYVWRLGYHRECTTHQSTGITLFSRLSNESMKLLAKCSIWHRKTSLLQMYAYVHRCLGMRRIRNCRTRHRIMIGNERNWIVIVTLHITTKQCALHHPSLFASIPSSIPSSLPLPFLRRGL